MAALVCLAVSVPSFAQEDMPEMPQFSVIMAETVAPEMTAEYEEGTKKLMEVLKANNVPFPVWAWQESNGTYNYNVPVKNFASIDEFSGHWAKAVAELRKSDWGKKRQAAIQSTKYTIWYNATHLSFMPENPELADNEIMYFQVLTFRVSHSKENAFNEVMMKMAAWSKDIGYRRPYSIHRNIIGEEGPVYVVVMPSKDPADHYNAMVSFMEKHGEAFAPLKTEMDRTVVSATEAFGWMRMDLSLMSPGM